MTPRKWNPKNSGHFHSLKEKVRAALASQDSRFEMLKLAGKHGSTIGAAYTAVMEEQKHVGETDRRRLSNGPSSSDHS